MAKLFSRFNSAIRQRAVLDAYDGLTTSFAPVPQLMYLTTPVLAAASFVQNTSYPFWTAPSDGKTWKVVGISYRFTVQSTGASTFGLEHAATAVAPGSGTLQTGALTLQGTANTTINGTLTTQTTVSPGQSLNFVVTNTAATTGLAGLTISLILQRVT